MSQTTNRLISLEEYIREKYIGELNDLLLDSTIRGFMAVPETIVFDIIDCWANSDTEFGCLAHYSADVIFNTLPVSTQSGCGIDIEIMGSIDGDEICCEFYRCDNRRKVLEEKRLYYLDAYLIPKAKVWRVNQICEEILQFYCPDAMRDKKPVEPKALAKAMGLEIVHYPLLQMKKKCSLLVTEETTFQLVRYSSADPGEVTIREDTILINTENRQNRWCEDNNIAHECYHYAGQRLFHALQKAAHIEFPYLDAGEGRALDTQETSMRCLEWQAMVGATFLRYPGSFASAEIRDTLPNFDPATMNQGERYEAAIKSVSGKHRLPGGLVKRALRFTGNIAVKGAWNYVDGTRIKPFEFDTSYGRGPVTFVISMHELMRLYAENAHLRNAILKNTLVYADGHVCVNSPEYIIDAPGADRQLTKKALSHMDDCCLKFYRDYKVRANGEYRHGLLFCDEDQLKAHSSLSEGCGNNEGLIKLAYDVFEQIRTLPFGFAETLKSHRENLRLTQEELAEKAQIDRVTISRIEKHITTEYRMDIVIKLAIGLGLSRQYAFDFFRKARFFPDNSPAGYAVDFIISNLQSCKLEIAESLSNEYYAILKSSNAENAAVVYNALEEKRKKPQENRVI